MITLEQVEKIAEILDRVSMDLPIPTDTILEADTLWRAFREFMWVYGPQAPEPDPEPYFESYCVFSAHRGARG